jgi:predicted DNA-binding transcriptional regulator AlpA
MEASPTPPPKLNPNMLLTPRAMCQFLSISRRTLRLWVQKGILPPPLRLGPDGRTLRWHPGHVVDFLQQARVNAAQRTRRAAPPGSCGAGP